MEKVDIFIRASGLGDMVILWRFKDRLEQEYIPKTGEVSPFKNTLKASKYAMDKLGDMYQVNLYIHSDFGIAYLESRGEVGTSKNKELVEELFPYVYNYDLKVFACNKLENGEVIQKELEKRIKLQRKLLLEGGS